MKEELEKFKDLYFDSIQVIILEDNKFECERLFFESIQDLIFILKDSDFKFCGASDKEIHLMKNNRDFTFQIEDFCFSSPYDEINL